MRKIILDFYDVTDELAAMKAETERKTDSTVRLADIPENAGTGIEILVQEYIAEKMNFPKHYGKNLDALYDCLTDLGEPTAVGFFLPTVSFDDLSIDLMLYLDKVRNVFLDAERDNSDYLAVITAEGQSAVPEEDPDEELSELIATLSAGENQ